MGLADAVSALVLGEIDGAVSASEQGRTAGADLGPDPGVSAQERLIELS